MIICGEAHITRAELNVRRGLALDAIHTRQGGDLSTPVKMWDIGPKRFP